MTSLTSTILPRPLTLCNLSMFKQTLSGSWKYKCQVFPHENSCDLDPGGKHGPAVCFFFQLTHITSDFPFLLFLLLFLMPSSLMLTSTSPSLVLFPCLCLQCGAQDLSTCLQRALWKCCVAVTEDNGLRVFCDVMIPAIASCPPLVSRGQTGMEGNGARTKTHKVDICWEACDWTVADSDIAQDYQSVK